MGRHTLDSGYKRCNTCGTRYPKFVFQSRRADCPDCRAERDRCRTHGLEPGEWKQMLHAQGDACAVCSTSDLHELVVDHDHTTGKVRGLLCSRCNLALGQLKDNPDFILNAYLYLQNPPYETLDRR